MQAPKILPWVAHRHAVDLERAEALWAQAVAMADFHYGRAEGGSDYWKYAVETFLRLARCDGAALIDAGAAVRAHGASPAVETVVIQGRIGEITLSALAQILHVGTRIWAAGMSRAANDERVASVRRQ
ncbi:MAG: hypothetical protein MUF79_06205 [Burkholderiales bacterium]|jgi:hypothetical protein|nr:hypothetical protein [Burkholderiales bacterium]